MTTSPSAAAALLDPDHPLKRETERWARAAMPGDDLVERDLELGFDRSGWTACAARGILGLTVPVEHGGSDAGLAETLLVLEGLGAGCQDLGLVFAIASQLFSAQVALVRFGDEAQRERWLPPLVRGDAIAAFAISEPDSGSDTYGLQATARRVDGGYVLDGHKAWITNAPVADVVIVFASTRPEAGRWGITAFVVPTDLPGVEIEPTKAKMGLRTTPFGDVVLRGVEVPESARLGPEGAGASLFAAAMEAERAYVLVGQIGALERELDEAVAFAREREQFGQAIGRFQAVAHRIADMKVRHETARTLMYRAAMLDEAGRDTAMAAAAAKLVASEAAVESGLDRTLLHGARGYVTEYGIERGLRDAVGGLIYSGTSDIQRNVVARLLGVG